MKPTDAQLLKILEVGHDTSLRGGGLSLLDALQGCQYLRLRSSIDADDLLPLIRADRSIARQWILYSNDKRTTGGWYLAQETCEVGTLGDPPQSVVCPSIEEAVALYVIRELDFWSNYTRKDAPDARP
jgi:hypothetical protein